MSEYDRRLHAALMHMRQHQVYLESVVYNADTIRDRMPWDPALAIPPLPSSGPSSADGAEVSSPRPPASPGGGDFHKRVCDLLGLSDGYHGSYIYADEERVLQEIRELQQRANYFNPSGPPGVAAAKESTDNAAAPEGAALHDVEPERCSCEEAEALRDKLKERDKLLRHVARDLGSLLEVIGAELDGA